MVSLNVEGIKTEHIQDFISFEASAISEDEPRAGDVAQWLSVCLACVRLWVPSPVLQKQNKTTTTKKEPSFQ
jgi:hypothetical protein